MPVLKATSAKVAIKDGGEPVTRFWQHLVPKAKTIFPILKTARSRRLVFYTDSDSIALEVAPNQSYHLVVLLNRLDSCFVELSTKSPLYQPTSAQSDTIPIVLDKNNGICLPCRLNGVPVKACIFDSGASHTYLAGDSLDKKMHLVLDGFIEDESVSGLATKPTSRGNHLNVGQLYWQNMPLVYIQEAGYTAGGLWVGYNAVENKVVELNFDNSQMILHERLPADMSGYKRVPMRHTSGGTYIKVGINDGKTDHEGWFLFDTGASMTLCAAGRFPQAEGLFEKLKKIGSATVGSTEEETFSMDVVRAPKLTIGGIEIGQIPIFLGKEDRSQMGLNGSVGVELMRGFNIVVDYPNSQMWVQPNHLFKSTFEVKKGKKPILWVVAAAAMLGLSLFYIRRRIKKILCFLFIFPSLNLSFAQEGNLIRNTMANNFSLSYKQLKEYEGVYEYKNNTTLKIAASPIDTILICIIHESRYPFSTLSKDVFLNATRDSVVFFRNKNKKVAGCISGKDTFMMLHKKVNFPKNMWYARLNAPKDYAYTYKMPNCDKDGINVGNMDSTRLDKKLIAEMVEKIVRGTYPNVHSVLIVKDDRLVLEEYFYEHNKNKLHELRSATKNFISALTGIAIEKGYIKSVNEKVLPFFPEYTFQNISEEKRKMNIENLLTNQSGLNCDTYNPKAVGNESIMAYEKDWIQYSLDLPMNDSAGGIGQYCSSNPIIMGRIIEKSTNMPLAKFAEQTLFRDLGIKKFDWHFKPDLSSAETFCQLSLRSRDMAKLGMLYLNNGLWNGKQVISKEWIEQSLTKHAVVAGLDYGYLWWTRYLDANGTRYYGKLAQGNGGQKIYIFKELHLVVVITAGHYNMQSSSNELVSKYILPSFNPAASGR